MKRLHRLLISILALFFITGCSFYEPNTSLMSPPKLPGTKAELKESLSKYIPNNADLLTPINSEKNNPIMLVDLDGDGKEEAIVFYQSTVKTELAKGIILKNNDGWEKVASIDGGGAVLVDLQFTDITNDNRKEIIAGFTYSEESTERGLLIYDIFSEETPKLLLDESYSHFLVDNFDEKEAQELILIKFDKGKFNTLLLYGQEKDTLVVRDRLELDPYINGYYNLISGKVSTTKNGIMLDASIGAHSATTYIIVVEENRLQNMYSQIAEKPLHDTFKIAAVKSEDINFDGILEYGTLIEPVLEKQLAYVDTPYITVYYQIGENDQTEIIDKLFIQYQLQYKISIPLHWPAIKINQSDDRKYTEILDAETNDVLFDVYVTNKYYDPNDEWTILAENNNFIYLSKSADEETENLFQLLNENE
ncbi:FG-GAP repeat domain-containing protein [Lederbergia graminis]|uniref:FG-GAP repeat domain-containing protein n=1 Tax=Lederbergia graminis TaxID=735518 RepID=A0ABW0LMM5_9BACI